MTSNRTYLKCLIFAALASMCTAFVAKPAPARNTVQLQAKPFEALEAKIAVASAFVMANVPSAVLAVVEDDYEYGKVDAPIGLAVAGGILAVATALLPLALRGGEEAFEEIREREAGTFGKNNKDVLKKK